MPSLFEVQVKNTKVQVKLPRNLAGDEMLRLVMSDGSLAFLRIAREHQTTQFRMHAEYTSQSLWDMVVGAAIRQVILDVRKRSSDRIEVEPEPGHSQGNFYIGRPLNVMLSLLVKQGEVVGFVERRGTSRPITIVDASASTTAEAIAQLQDKQQ